MLIVHNSERSNGRGCVAWSRQAEPAKRDVWSSAYTKPDPNTIAMRGTNRHLHASSSGRSSPKLSARPSSASLRAKSTLSNGATSSTSPLAADAGLSEVDNGRFSLAQELAAVMLPDPNSSSRALAEELGLDFDEGEGDDQEVVATATEETQDPAFWEGSHDFGANEHIQTDAHSQSEDEESVSRSSSPQNHVAVTTPTPRPRTSLNGVAKKLFDASPVPPSPTISIHQDPIEILAQELASTDAFISSLRRLDHDSSSSFPADTSSNIPQHTPSNTGPSLHATSSEPTVERYTSRMIRQLNDSARERETQLRELVAIDKEFKRIEGEVGGGVALGALDPLDDEDGLFDDDESSNDNKPVEGHLHPLSGIHEDEEEEEGHLEHDDDDEEEEEEDDHDEDEDVFGEPPSPSLTTRRSSTRRSTRNKALGDPQAPPLHKPGIPITPSSALPHLSYMRSLTSSLVSSLSSLSEYAQENGAATADAGRKIRSLKNKIASLQSEWDIAEKSQRKIEEWEKEQDGKGERVDGRIIVKEQLAAFEQALADAAVKTQAIMAA